MPFKIVRNDITKIQVDAIVNTASPFYIDGNYGEADLLRSCYERSLQMALEHQYESIAFPLSVTGNFGYPKEEGLEIALNVIHNFLVREDMMIYLVVSDNESVKLSGKLYDDIEAFIDQEDCRPKPNLMRPIAPTKSQSIPRISASTMMFQSAPSVQRQAVSVPEFLKKSTSDRSLEDVMNNLGETFQQRLFRLIDEKGRTDIEAYKGAGKDKKLFHKIRSNVDYQPTKHTVFAFALSLELSLDETKDLLASAGFAFSPSNRFDRFMHYIIEHEIYNIQAVDCCMYDVGLTQFFSCEP